MEQTKALNALEPFLALTKSATSPRAAADLIARATSAPNTYIFAELLSAPQIQALDASDFSSSLALLKIFSYGTWNDYHTYSTTSPDAPALPTLNDAQILKLRQLTLLTLNPSDLTYDKLTTVLGLSSTRELEDLVISCIYAGLITGTLDPANTRVHVSSVAPLRDIKLDSIPSMISALQVWSARCDDTLKELQAKVVTIKQDAAKRKKADEKWAAYVEKMIDHEGKGSWDKEPKGGNAGWWKGGAGKRGNSDEDIMEIDDPAEADDNRGSSTKPNKKGKSGGLGGFITSSFGGKQ